MSITLLLAGLYNILFGAWAVLFPHSWFDLSGMNRPLYPEIWQSVGMIVGVYGLGYMIAATDPVRHYPIILVGFLGKIFGPIGFVSAIVRDVFPAKAAFVILTNDLIWWVPFALILWHCFRSEVGQLEPSNPISEDEALETFTLNSGETLSQASSERTLILVFLRHFGCTFTRETLKSLNVLEDEAERRDAELVLVHMLHEGQETKYLPGKVSKIADPNCQLYNALGLGKGKFSQLFGFKVWLKGVFSIFRGCGVGPLAGDGLQMPGVFLVEKGKVTARRPAKTAADLPDIEALFDKA